MPPPTPRISQYCLKCIKCISSLFLLEVFLFFSSLFQLLQCMVVFICFLSVANSIQNMINMRSPYFILKVKNNPTPNDFPSSVGGIVLILLALNAILKWEHGERGSGSPGSLLTYLTKCRWNNFNLPDDNLKTFSDYWGARLIK